PNPYLSLRDLNRGYRRSARPISWRVQKESLHEMNAKLFHGLVLFGTLDALGNHFRILVVRETHHRLDEILLDEVRVDAIDQRDIQLDEIRLEVGDRSESGVTAPCIIDRESISAIAKILQT